MSLCVWRRCVRRCLFAWNDLHRLAKIAKFLGLTKQRKNQWKNNAVSSAKKMHKVFDIDSGFCIAPYFHPHSFASPTSTVEIPSQNRRECIRQNPTMLANGLHLRSQSFCFKKRL